MKGRDANKRTIDTGGKVSGVIAETTIGRQAMYLYTSALSSVFPLAI